MAIDTLDDMETLFQGIDLGDVTVSMTINAPAAIMLAFYVVAAEENGVPADRLGGTIQADILKEYIAQKEWCFPVDPAMRLLGDMMEWSTRNMPRWHPVSISGYHIREAGSTAAQELAFTLKDGFTYVEEQMARGIDVDDFAPRLSFFFNAQIDFFEEIAKYRAARRIWARELRDTYGAKNPRSWLMRFHTQTAGVSLTAQQPLNNIVRTAIEALAGVLGGTQSLHTNSYDEALALPTEDAVRIALRTQQIIAHETGVTNTVDPLGGSYFVEALTDEHRGAGVRATSPRSTSSAAWSRRSSATTRSARSPTPRSSCRRKIDAASRSWSASTATPRATTATRRCCASTPRSSASRSAASRPSARAATARRSSARSPRCGSAAATEANLMPHAGRVRPRARHRGRDRRRAPGGLGRVHRSAGVLTGAASARARLRASHMPLPFDPIAEARRQWEVHWGDGARALDERGDLDHARAADPAGAAERHAEAVRPDVSAV